MASFGNGIVLRVGGKKVVTHKKTERIIRCNYCKMAEVASKGGHMIRDRNGEIVCPVLIDVMKKTSRQNSNQIACVVEKKMESMPSIDAAPVVAQKVKPNAAPLKTSKGRFASLMDYDDDDEVKVKANVPEGGTQLAAPVSECWAKKLPKSVTKVDKTAKKVSFYKFEMDSGSNYADDQKTISEKMKEEKVAAEAAAAAAAEAAAVAAKPTDVIEAIYKAMAQEEADARGDPLLTANLIQKQVSSLFDDFQMNKNMNWGDEMDED